MLAWVCGDVCVWKPSEKTPLTAIACQHIAQEVFAKNDVPEGVSCLVIGDRDIGELMANDTRVPLVSATGSTRMGKAVGAAVGARLGRSLLELGGNNAIIVSQYADLDTVLVGAVFGAVGTAGQRCTSTRRLIIHESVYEQFKQKIVNAYGQMRIGDPLDEHNHMGPLIDTRCGKAIPGCHRKMQSRRRKVCSGRRKAGRRRLCLRLLCEALYCRSGKHYQIVQHETFAPILYLIKYKTLSEAIAKQNGVPQGLSSAIMTNNLREAEQFLSYAGSDCGIANVNIGTSGAEIGGAFGGEKETGGGRESGSDAWKVYMRRQTNTINYSTKLPLAQGIKFDL